jgi:hypothetical protein
MQQACKQHTVCGSLRPMRCAVGLRHLLPSRLTLRAVLRGRVASGRASWSQVLQQSAEGDPNAAAAVGALLADQAYAHAQSRAHVPGERALSQAARRILYHAQTAYRAHRAYRKWHPIIRMRLRCGRHVYMQHAMQMWRHFLLVVKRARSIFTRCFEHLERAMFLEWRDHVQKLRVNRKNHLK